jgi:glycosyltransferase involved in cell wall biosynthesis
MKKPAILIIENSVDMTGALKSIVLTANDLKDFYDFKFVIPQGSRCKQWLTEKGFSSIRELPMKEINKSFFSAALYIPYLLLNTFRLRKIVLQENISIVHVNDVYNLLPAILHLFGSKVSYVSHIRFLPNKFPSWILNFWMMLHFRYASKVVAVSNSVLNMLPPHPKLTLIYDGVPTGEKYPQPTEPVQQKTNFTFLYLSNFMEGKGHDYAIEAFATIRQELPGWKLRFVGSDMGLKKNELYRENLKEKSKALDVAEKTEWHGFTEDVETEYKHADVVLNFSESESFSITCVEALYYGRPLIATDCGGPGEIIDRGITGILVPNKNKMEMAKAMKKMAVEMDRGKEMGMAGRIAVRKKFSVDNTSFRLGEIYKQILKGTERND